MIEGIYQGAASMDALERWQSSIADNLASSSVPGYKGDETSFSGVAAGSTKLAPGDFGAAFARQAPKESHHVNTQPGTVLQTGKDTDLAVQGSGFFQVQGPDGKPGYTRNGEFHLDRNGTLVTNAGQQVMGEGGALTIDPTLGAVTVDHTGQVSQGGNIVGKIALYDAGASDQLQRAANGMLVTKDGSTPKLVENPEVQQGYIEQSNVQPLQEMVNMISVSRAYEISQKLITSLDRTTGSAIESLGTP